MVAAAPQVRPTWWQQPLRSAFGPAICRSVGWGRGQSGYDLWVDKNFLNSCWRRMSWEVAPFVGCDASCCHLLSCGYQFRSMVSELLSRHEYKAVSQSIDQRSKRSSSFEEPLLRNGSRSTFNGSSCTCKSVVGGFVLGLNRWSIGKELQRPAANSNPRHIFPMPASILRSNAALKRAIQTVIARLKSGAVS